MSSRKPITNRILSRLSPADFALLESRLTAVELPLRKQLEMPQKPITYVYFIESGYASVVANGDDKRSIEIGLIGREGMTGLAVVMGTDRTHHETFMQCAGRGWRISAQNLRDVMEKSTGLRNRLLQIWSCLSHANDLHGNSKCSKQDRGAPGTLAVDGARPS